MQQKIRLALSFSLGTILLFAACSEQRTQPMPEISNTVVPPSTVQPTQTLTSIQSIIDSSTPAPEVQTSDHICAKNPVPAELLASQPEIENNKLIAFSTEHHSDIYWDYSDVYTVNFDGTGLKKLTSYPGNDNMSHWSVDGREILFYSERYQPPCKEYAQGFKNCGLELFVMNADGSGSRKATPDLPYYPGRSPDGKYVVYEKEFYDELRLQHGLGDFLSDIIVRNISGSYERNITNQFQPGVFYDVNWSPDSKFFAFVGAVEPIVYTDQSFGGAGYRKKNAYLAKADGSDLQKLPGGPFRGYGSIVSWSPNGKRLAFLTSNGIAIIDADGSGFLEYAIDQNFGERQVFWLEDSEHLVFTDADGNYYQIKTDFTGLEKISFATDVDRLLFLFQLLKTRSIRDGNKEKILSPDGKWIAYWDGGQGCSQIRVTNVETGVSYFVVDWQAVKELKVNASYSIYNGYSISPYGFLDDLIWSPDSQQLLFTELVQYDLILHEYQGLFAVNLDGTGLRLIAENAWYPEIQP